MFRSIWEDVKREFSYGNMVTRIIIINVAFFIVLNLIWVILRITNEWEDPKLYNIIAQGLMISNDGRHILTHPWAIFTHMFLHKDFIHILWNMLLLYWFGRIVGDFLGNQRVLPIYLLGGLAGALAFVLAYNLPPFAGTESFALGASAAVMAIIVAAGVTSPDYVLQLLFLGGIKLKYIVGVLVLLDQIGMAGNINTGGHFAHLGGALMGAFFVMQLRRGNDWSLIVNRLMDRVFTFLSSLFGRGSKMRVENNRSQRGGRPRRANNKKDGKDKSHQEHVDAILDKIRESGYDSLTDEEKEFLFNASKE